jgi:hypothetical protein
MFKTRKRVVFSAFLGMCVLTLSAQNAQVQPQGNSPYSRFGLGDPAILTFAGQTAMGGLGAAYNDPFYMNMANPAALGYLAATDFETGFFAQFSGLSDGDTSAGLWSGNLSYLALAFPLLNPINRALDKKSSDIGIGMGFVLQPYANVGYDIFTEQQFPEVGAARTSFKGAGGSYRLMWGNGFRYKRFALGVNLGYLFGKASYDRTVEFTEVGSVAYVTNYLNEQSVSGFLWNAGAQMTVPLQKQSDSRGRTLKEKSLIFGLYGNSSTGFRTIDSRLDTRTNFVYNDRDTLLVQDNTRGSGVLPGEYTVGVTYSESNKLKLGIEYSTAFWSGYRNDAREETLTDTRRIAAGVEYIPDIISYNNYFRRVRYRGGIFYRTDPRTVNGRQLNEFGLTMGMGLPVILPRQQTSFINLTLEGGRFGVASALRETYVRMTLGFTLNDNTWFFKRKFN